MRPRFCNSAFSTAQEPAADRGSRLGGDPVATGQTAVRGPRSDGQWAASGSRLRIRFASASRTHVRIAGNWSISEWNSRWPRTRSSAGLRSWRSRSAGPRPRARSRRRSRRARIVLTRRAAAVDRGPSRRRGRRTRGRGRLRASGRGRPARRSRRRGARPPRCSLPAEARQQRRPLEQLELLVGVRRHHPLQRRRARLIGPGSITAVRAAREGRR